MDWGSEKLKQLASDIEKMSNEEYLKLFEEVKRNYKEFNEMLDNWPDNYDDQCGITRYFRYQFPYFPYFSIEFVKVGNRISIVSLGIFKDKLYMVLDLD